MGIITPRRSAGTDWGELLLAAVAMGGLGYSLTGLIFENELLAVLAGFIAALTLTLPMYRWAKWSQARQK